MFVAVVREAATTELHAMLPYKKIMNYNHVWKISDDEGV